MVSNLLQVDWVFVDTIIIILLFILLIGIKIFKSTHRWRLKFSNKAIVHYSFTELHEINKNQYIKVKEVSITMNSSLKTKHNKRPTIIILRSNVKKRLINLLTEGLSSYGLNVIHVYLKFKVKTDSNLNKELIKSETKSLIPSIINFFKKKQYNLSPDYITLNYSNSLTQLITVNSNILNSKLILINSKVKKKDRGIIKEILSNPKNFYQLYHIYSEKQFFVFKNTNLKSFLNEHNSLYKNKLNVLILKKSNSNFKYYETILFGAIIDMIESKTMKYKNQD
ncbi:MAG: hypothetical protein ACFFEN_02175 [Candidatus Thorarchaeota archaeon]